MEKIFEYDQLLLFTKNVFRSIGSVEEHAQLAATGLLRADLRGIDSHPKLNWFMKLLSQAWLMEMKVSDWL
jgi:LDH2 family malate/lactate/ureidoglycolate dehydrogenase